MREPAEKTALGSSGSGPCEPPGPRYAHHHCPSLHLAIPSQPFHKIFLYNTNDVRDPLQIPLWLSIPYGKLFQSRVLAYHFPFQAHLSQWPSALCPTSYTCPQQAKFMLLLLPRMLYPICCNISKITFPRKKPLLTLWSGRYVQDTILAAWEEHWVWPLTIPTHEQQPSTCCVGILISRVASPS